MDKEQNIEALSCCVSVCEKPLDLSYWNKQYEDNTTGWDLGTVSPPIKKYIDSIGTKDIAILIPGCGNSYEADYLMEQGFSKVTVIDIAPLLVAELQKKYGDNPNIQVILGDFFQHEGHYDLIIEQTFFCALPPNLRLQYVAKMFQLLKQDGKLAGLMFNRSFEKSPPFGGSREEYETTFKNAFEPLRLELENNSVKPRANSELFVEMYKNSSATLALYKINGMTCSNCASSIAQILRDLPNVQNALINTSYTQLLIVGSEPIDIHILQQAIAHEEEYSISIFL